MTTPKNYTTGIAASESVGQLQALLGKNDCERIIIEYKNRLPVAISFSVHMSELLLMVKLPAGAEQVERSLQQTGVKSQYRSLEHAYNVAWRNWYEWVEQQLRLINSKQATPMQAFFAYLENTAGQSLYEQITSDAHLYLDPPQTTSR